MNAVTANNLAKWDGVSWFDMNWQGGLINAMAVDHANKLYIGSSSVSVWDGTSWSIVAPGVLIRSLICDASNNIIVGGSFTAIGNTNANHIARWDGQSWSPIGLGIDGVIWALAADKLGNLYAGGTFTSVGGGGTATNIARWDGVSWHGLPPRNTTAVRALAFDAYGFLYVGGTSGVASNCLARWDGTTWSPLGSGVDGFVSSLYCDDAQHLFLGGTFPSVGTNYSPFAAAANLPTELGLLNVSSGSGNSLRMVLQGRPGMYCRIEASSNLINWSSISTNVCETNGLWTVTNAVASPRTFFRAVLP